MKAEKMMSTKTMVSSVTLLVLFLLVNWAAVQARQVLNNSDMNGCAVVSGGNVLLGWTGTAICGPGGNTLPCSFSIGSILPGGPTSDPGFCAAFWQPGFSAYSQTLALTPGSETPGLYDFEAFWGCTFPSGGVGGGTCTISLTIGGTSIPLTGQTTRNAIRPTSYTSVTATGISITNPAAVVSINCVPTGDSRCFVTRATLDFDSLVVGDPHFVGLDGQRFDILGESGSAFNILSDNDVQVNCLLGLQQVGKHIFAPGPVMMTIAVLTPDHTILANAGGSSISDTGFVSVDGVKVGEGEKVVTEDGVSISFEKVNRNANDLGLGSDDHIAAISHIEIEGSYRFTVYFVENGRDRLNPDAWLTKFARRYLDLSAVLLDDSRAPHGILGQTHISAEDKKRSIKDWKMDGTEDDYKLKDGVLGSDFAFNKFRV